MARPPKDDQLDLFPGMTPVPAPLPVRPWRAVLPDDRRGRFEREPLEDFLIELLRRNRQLLKALGLAGVPQDAPGVERFRRQETPLIESVLELRRGKLPAAARREILRAALDTAEALAATRRRILEDLDPEPRERAIKAEPRVRIKDWDLRQELAEAQFALAEEQGEIIEIVLPMTQDEEPPPGILGLADVEALTQYSMQASKQEQEQRPLPGQLRLRTLLKGIPAIWLDAVCSALEVESGELRQRKEREQAVAETLTDVDRLRQIVRDKLSARERKLVAYLLENGGQSASGQVTRRFGRDLEDGWFWNEQPPASILGRVRLHGLAFVGRLKTKGRRMRTVAIPRELREPLAAVLEDCSRAGPAAASGSAEGSDLRAGVAETIERVFPGGVVDGPVDVELSYFTDVYPRLSTKLGRLKGASPAFERDPEGGPGWNVSWVREEEDYDDLSYSYYLFFLGLVGFDFDTEEESLDEDDVLRRVKGTGQAGCSVGVSLVAPVAKVVLQTMEDYEDGGYTIPDIDVGELGLGGGMSEESCRECVGEKGLQALLALREKVVSILGSLDVEVLPADELAKIVPWLKAGEEAFVGVGPPGEEVLTVADAFFFRGP